MAGLHNDNPEYWMMSVRSPRSRRDFGEDIRRRIKSVKNTQQVTKAMSLPYRPLSNWSN